MRPMRANVLAIPKAEHHVHLEAAITTTLAKKLAKRNGMTIPAEIMGEHDNFVCHDFHHFMQAYDIVAKVIQNETDYFDITYDYLKRSHEEGVIYSELFVSPEHAEMNQTPYEAMLEGVVAGIEKAKADFGIESRIIMVMVRHFGLDAVNKTANLIIKNNHPMVVGVTSAGDELQLSPKDFKPAYGKLADAGLKLTLHVGEICGPEKIWEAINELPLDRLGHGVRAIEDARLVETLVERQLPLEVCLTSNVFVGTYDHYAKHPFLKLLQKGVLLSLNSDDPTFFGTTIGGEYQIAHDLGVSENTLLQITRDAINTAFLGDVEKQQLLEKCHRCCSAE